ncbi:MAG: TolC family protein [Lachnospiraceae bacterium]|nr:TolC family protein [Lachnospiraceae bacterium]
MKIWKRALPLGLAGIMLTAAPTGALAASPEFARTGEEWARLRDNVLEYGELEDLVNEYNTTVQTNQLDLAEFKREYGTTRDDVASKYQDMADEIYASLDYPDSSDPTYGYVVGSLLSAEVQAKNLEKQADNTLEDSEVTYLTYKSAEKTLVTVAQSNMISYEKDQLSLQQAELAKKQAELSLRSAQSKQASGLATQVDVLNAQETMQNADRTIASTQTGIETVRQKLQVMLGWRFSDTPEIRAVPKSDISRIDQMNPQADKEKALENNYTLKANKKKLQNATSANVRESLEKTIADNEQKIGSALVTNYQNVLAAKLSYDQAAAALDLANRNLTSVQVQYQHGNASQMQYDNQQYTTQSAQLDVQIADLNLFQTMETYDWAVNGLASTS